MLLLSLALAADQVRISGRVESTVPGPIRIELLQVEEHSSAQLLVAYELLEEPGPFVLIVTDVSGTVHLRAAADPDGDGVGPDDPQTLHPPFILEGDPVGGLTLTLVLPGEVP